MAHRKKHFSCYVSVCVEYVVVYKTVVAQIKVALNNFAPQGVFVERNNITN